MIGRLKFDISELVNEMLDQLPLELFESSTTTFLDPCMGGGQFVAAVERRLRSAGHSDKNIAQRVYGFESNQMRVNYAINKHGLTGNYQALDFLETDVAKEFDVILGNPPFNSNDTSRSSTNHRGQGENLAKKFALRSLKLSKQMVCLIMPYGHRTYSPTLEKEYRKNGLYQISKCEEHFPNISSNPCVFYFDKNQFAETVIDEYRSKRPIPEHNIGLIFRNQPGRLNRCDYEDRLLDKGKYRVVVTTARIRYTNEDQIVDDMQDRTRGHWRVVFNCTTSKGQIGRICVEGPESVLSKSVHCLLAENQNHAVKLKQYLESQEVSEILKEVKNVNACNSKKFLQYIPLPETK